MAKKTDTTDIIEITDASMEKMVHVIRGKQVMLDRDLAMIYGYSTKDFNRQVKNNIEKFEEDFMFQLTDEEVKSLRWNFCTSNEEEDSRSKKNTLNNEESLKSKILTSNDSDGSRCKNSTLKIDGRGHNIKYAPYAFTEQGIYMLMTVLKGPLATMQSKALIRTFKKMKDYIIENQPLLGQREYLQLSLQTTENMKEMLEMRKSLNDIDDKVADIVDKLGDVVTHSELSNIMLDFSKPAVRYGWLILDGQPVESDLAYQQMYSEAKHTIYVIDNYIGLRTLVQMKNIPSSIPVTIISDNLQHHLHKSEYDDFCQQYTDLNINFLRSGGNIHDRYIVIDYNTDNEKIYHCGASSKDAGKKVTTITLVTDAAVYHPLIDSLLQNPTLTLN